MRKKKDKIITPSLFIKENTGKNIDCINQKQILVKKSIIISKKTNTHVKRIKEIIQILSNIKTLDSRVNDVAKNI